MLPAESVDGNPATTLLTCAPPNSSFKKLSGVDTRSEPDLAANIILPGAAPVVISTPGMSSSIITGAALSGSNSRLYLPSLSVIALGSPGEYRPSRLRSWNILAPTTVPLTSNPPISALTPPPTPPAELTKPEKPPPPPPAQAAKVSIEDVQSSGLSANRFAALPENLLGL